MLVARWTCRSAVSGRIRMAAILPLVAFLLPIMLIFLGFAVDLAYMQATRLELRCATDCAARAAATTLAMSDSVVQARNRAKQTSLANRVAGERLRLRDSDIEFGHSIPNADGKWEFVGGVTPYNAVRIRGARDASSFGGPVGLFFGGLIGRANFEPVTSATASFINVDVCLVLDRSTSMKVGVNSNESGLYTSDPRFCRPPNSQSRWVALDGAVRVFIDALRESDGEEQVALVTYSSDLSNYRPPLCGASSSPSSLDAHLDFDLSRIEDAMDDRLATVWNGNTYIEAGMRTGLAALSDSNYARRTAEQVMIVLTDGNQNIGDAMDAAEDCENARIPVHTITFSIDANQSLMQDVAAKTGGKHYHANNAQDLRRVFEELAARVVRLTE